MKNTFRQVTLHHAICNTLKRYKPIEQCKIFAISTALIMSTATADDTEIYTNSISSGDKPNVVFIVDTNTNMNASLTNIDSDDAIDNFPPISNPAAIVHCVNDLPSTVELEGFAPIRSLHILADTVPGDGFGQYYYSIDDWPDCTQNIPNQSAPETTAIIPNQQGISNSLKQNRCLQQLGIKGDFYIPVFTSRYAKWVIDDNSDPDDPIGHWEPIIHTPDNPHNYLDPSIKFYDCSFDFITSNHSVYPDSENINELLNVAPSHPASQRYLTTDPVLANNSDDHALFPFTPYPDFWLGQSAYGEFDPIHLIQSNSLHWYKDPDNYNPDHLTSQLKVIQRVFESTLNAATSVNIALMRYNPSPNGGVSNSAWLGNEGGIVDVPMFDISDQTKVDEANKVLKQIVNKPVNPLYARFTEVDDTYASAPLLETLYEAMLYYQGGEVKFGDSNKYPDNAYGTSTHPIPSLLDSHEDSKEPILGTNRFTYKSPITENQACGGNHIVYIGSGLRFKDTSARPELESLLAPENPGIVCSNPAQCLSEFSEYLYTTDFIPDIAEDPVNGMDGIQNIKTHYVVTFSDQENEAFPQDILEQYAQTLDDAAAAGGTGSAIRADSAEELASALETIFASIQTSGSSTIAPAIPVDSLNQLQNKNDLYFALFEPGSTPHWDGNIKRYHLKAETVGGETIYSIVDSQGNPAVDVGTGTLIPETVSDWSYNNAEDGEEVRLGGLANRVHPYVQTDDSFTSAERKSKVLTYLTDYAPGVAVPLSDALIEVDEDETTTFTRSYFLDPGNLDANNNRLPFSDTAQSVTDPGYISDSDFRRFLAWIRGADIFNADTTTIPESYPYGRNGMGGMLHTSPVLINIDSDDKGDNDPSNDEETNILVAVTNDGYFHIFNPDQPNSSDRLEHVAIVPKQTLEDMYEIYSPDSGNVAHRLDGNIEVWRYDAVSDDGAIGEHADDHIYVYFGQRRGGRAMFAFDITDYTDPRLLWVIDPENSNTATDPFLDMGQTWSTPEHHRILKDTYNGGQAIADIVIYGGGYDAVEDDKEGEITITLNSGQTITEIIGEPRNEDNIGNAIYIVDALTGERLWSAGKTSNHDFTDSQMKYSFAADMKTIDLNGDKIADKIFAADTGGQIWRFDLDNGLDNITGGVIADVQENSSAPSETAISSNRRFYNEPDVVVVREGASTRLAIAIGTGFRAHPNDVTANDKLIVFKYNDVKTIPNDYSAIKLTLGDLTNVTNELEPDPATVLNGWYIDLANSDTPITTGGNSVTPVGEKSLSKSITVNGIVLFTSYIPPTTNELTNTDECAPPPLGYGRVYAVNILNGSPVTRFTGSAPNTAYVKADRIHERKAGGITPAVKVIFPGGDTATSGTSGSIEERREVQFLSGLEFLNLDLDIKPRQNHWMYQ